MRARTEDSANVSSSSLIRWGAFSTSRPMPVRATVLHVLALFERKLYEIGTSVAEGQLASLR